MSAAEAQAALRAIAFDPFRIEERCQEVLDSLLRSEDEEAMFEGRIPWDLPTQLRPPWSAFDEAEGGGPIRDCPQGSYLTQGEGFGVGD
ncbi:MAG TPA: hypothetical protein VLF66_17215 [Thermoanaerobaculia bacterium]|nr:hypothetical protein [Thermoanaerobaculia bacterium]